MTSDETVVAREPNDGSRNDMRNNKYDEERYSSRDTRAETKTTFARYEIDSLPVSQARKKQLKRMYDRQEGVDKGEAYPHNTDREQRKARNRREWRRRVITTYASQIGLTNYQQSRCKHIFVDFLSDNRLFTKFGPYSIEDVALGVIAFVCHEDRRRVESEEMFGELATKNGVNGKSSLRTLEGKVDELLGCQ